MQVDLCRVDLCAIYLCMIDLQTDRWFADNNCSLSADMIGSWMWVDKLELVESLLADKTQ